MATKNIIEEGKVRFPDEDFNEKQPESYGEVVKPGKGKSGPIEGEGDRGLEFENVSVEDNDTDFVILKNHY